MKQNNGLFLAGLVLYVMGLCTVCLFSNWQTCLGVFIMMWGNNLKQQIKT